MSALSIRLPDSLHKKIKEIAQRDNVSINQMITLAVAEKLSALETEDYLAQRTTQADRKKFRKALGKVQNRKPHPQDQI